MPEAVLAYLMDDAGFPYGRRTDADLIARVTSVIAAGVARLDPDLVVVACNTASTAALASLRAAHRVPFVGCVPPVKSAAAASRSKVIGVLATPATVRGGYLRDLSARTAPGCQVLVHGAAGLAALAEARFAGAAVALDDVRAELAGLSSQPTAAAMDAVALGCTHYARLLPELRACLPAHVAWLDPAPPVASQAARVAAGLAGAGRRGLGRAGAAYEARLAAGRRLGPRLDSCVRSGCRKARKAFLCKKEAKNSWLFAAAGRLFHPDAPVVARANRSFASFFQKRRPSFLSPPKPLAEPKPQVHPPLREDHQCRALPPGFACLPPSAIRRVRHPPSLPHRIRRRA